MAWTERDQEKRDRIVQLAYTRIRLRAPEIVRGELGLECPPNIKLILDMVDEVVLQRLKEKS